MDDFFGRTLKLRSVGILFRCHKSRAGKLLQTEHPRLRVTAQTILEFLFNGSTEEEILEQYPVLDKEDIEACKKFALEMMDINYRIKDIAA